MPIWLPGTIEFIWAGWIPPNPHHKIIPLQNYLFRDPKITPKTSPGQNVDLGVPQPEPGHQNPSPGMEKQKMCAEKQCRTPPSKNQTEPYSASYGRKPFWGVPLKILMFARGDLRGKCLFSIVKIYETETRDHFAYILEG